MSKVAICNVNSFGREYPELLEELIRDIGPVDKLFFDQNVSSEQIADRLEGYAYVILGTHPTLTKTFFEKNRTVRLIARHGLGVNNIDLKAAREYGVVVTKISNEIERDAVAEHAVALMLSLSKNLLIGNDMVQNGKWNVGRENCMGFQIRNSITGIIGCGNIGQRTAQIMKDGFNNKILVYDPGLPAEKLNALGFKKVELSKLIKESDFIFLHCALTESNHHLINENNLKEMKKNCILINCARGNLIDEKAVAKAVKNNIIFGYGADVCVQEPIESNNDLLHTSRIIISPHTAVYNYTCIKNMNRKVIEDIKAYESGKDPINIING